MYLFTKNIDDAVHREFLRGLSVQLGQILAAMRGGHPQPSAEVAEKEVEDVLRHYILMEKTGIADVVDDTAFVMARLLDPFNKQSLTYLTYLTEVFVSFFVSNLKILIDNGTITIVDPPEIEKTWRLSTEQKFMDQELADLDTWNDILKVTLEDILKGGEGTSSDSDDDFDFDFDEEEDHDE